MKMNSITSRIPIVHIGLPKTATTTLQWRLFSKHSEIYYLGRFDGKYFSKKYRHQFNHYRDENVQVLMNKIAHGDISNPDFIECKKLFKKIVEPTLEKNLVPVLSWESYSTDILKNRHIRAQNLKRVLGEAKIIITIRNPITLLESAYFQQLRRDNVGSRGSIGCKPYYQSIDKWLQYNFYGEILPHLEYAETIQTYADLFGIENVYVFLFEDLIADGDRFFGRICNALGVNAEEGIKLVKDRTDNKRWTTCQLEALKSISNSRLKSFFFRFCNKKRRKSLLELNEKGLPLNIGKKARATISETAQKKIFETTFHGNLWLQEKYGLPLKKYGYIQSKE